MNGYDVNSSWDDKQLFQLCITEFHSKDLFSYNYVPKINDH